MRPEVERAPPLPYYLLLSYALVMDSCGLVMGGDIHTDLDDDEVDWDFDTHPYKETGRITKA